MGKWQRRTALYLAGLGVTVAAFTVAYHYGMWTFEGETPTLLHSLQVVVETFTTTGFGSDAPWSSPQMNAIVVLMDVTGVVMIFLALPVLVFPLFQEALSTTVPTRVAADTSDHVVICTYTPRSDPLIAELESWGVEYVIVEPDRETAIQLHEDGYTVVHADPESVVDMENARADAARAVVADTSDRIDASIVLTAREVAEDVQVVSVVEEPENARYHRLAGADAVLTPREILGGSLATKVTTAVTTAVNDTVEIGADFEIAELPIHRGSDLVGSTLAESGIRERTGANVIGAWFRGEFESPPAPDSMLGAGTVLLVTGDESELEALKAMTRSGAHRFGAGETVVVAYGEVGRTVADALDAAGLPHTIVDLDPKPGVDVVGDAIDPDVLREAGVEDARSVVLALPDDTTAEFAILVVRDCNPAVEIVARAEEEENVQKMYRAGADYVLSLAVITGRMIASTILEDEHVISLDAQVEVVQTDATALAGRTIRESAVRDRTGCTIVGVEREGRVITGLDPSFRIRPGDEVILAGTTDGTNHFVERYG